MTRLRPIKLGIAIMAVTTFFAYSGQAHATEIRRSVTMACNPFPPSKISETAPLPGYDIELLKAAFSVGNLTLKTPFYPWKRAYLLAEEGRVDGLCSCSYTVEREADMLYSAELGRIRIGLFSIAGRISRKITSLGDARNLRIGVVGGYNLENTAENAGLTVITATREQILLGMLYNNRIDMIYSFREPVMVAHKARNTGLALRYHETSQAPYYSCISRKIDDAPALLNTLNNGIKTIRANGVYQNILEKYGVADVTDIKQPTAWTN
ncbi:ABC transporter substrate-binding protein [uncultured Thalassospira sp.]|uniref:substrate-binding periplasmic protein n=1 Tax=uncultured Thalassospira sp. TaxID=404382 RepID=UPI0030D8B64C|tara:strand:+ start:4019 stop:4819 length:801 start_codon:yes stop_codon:yes gene_type:complete